MVYAEIVVSKCRNVMKMYALWCAKEVDELAATEIKFESNSVRVRAMKGSGEMMQLNGNF